MTIQYVRTITFELLISSLCIIHQGVCVDSSQDLASQLWTVITALDIDRSGLELIL